MFLLEQLFETHLQLRAQQYFRTPGLQRLVRPEQKTKLNPQLVRPKHRVYDFSSFFPGRDLSCKIEIFKPNISNSYSWYPSPTCIHYASFSNSVCRFRGKIYSLTRLNPKLHDACEVLARI